MPMTKKTTSTQLKAMKGNQVTVTVRIGGVYATVDGELREDLYDTYVVFTPDKRGAISFKAEDVYSFATKTNSIYLKG